MMHSMRMLGVATSLSLAVLISCSSQSPSDRDQNALGDDTQTNNPTNDLCPHDDAGSGGGCGSHDGGTSPAPVMCSDGQAAAILDTLDMGEVEESKAVVDASIDASLQDFARMMIKEHGAHRDALKTLTAKLDISLAATGVSREMSKDSKKDITMSRTLARSELQSHYLNRQVLGHIRALGVIEMLIPSCKAPEFRDFVIQTRATVRQHLALVLTIQSKLEGACGGNAGGGTDEPDCDDAGMPIDAGAPVDSGVIVH
ncbi:DUF4142 domain-containing protein [Pendulispora brunnea]|uniref:DUF4142 domain-containing protein n=1 Tax=Pendulispora brunnea TaxID=2905690 RepID=A0ABZ2K9L7_9BACT